MAPAIIFEETSPIDDTTATSSKAPTSSIIEKQITDDGATTITTAETPTAPIILSSSKHVGKQPESALMHRSLIEQPHEVLSASGSYLHLTSGTSILDGCGGAAAAIIGHGNQEVISATLAQMQKVSYVHTLSYITSSAEDLATHILSIPPGGFQHGLEKAYFCGSGSEANDIAMKLARQYHFENGEPQRKWYVSRKQAYHGNSIGSMSVSSYLARKVPYKDGILMDKVAFVSPAYAYQYQRADDTEQQYVDRLIKELDDEFQRLGPENVISFIAEPVVGATSGCVPAPKGYFPGVRALCSKYGILLHLDEIMCGMGRTGTYFAFEQENIAPDIVTIGKGLGGGYAPIAGVLMNKKVVDGLRRGSKAFNHGQTYQAHPVTCATALAVQRVVRREGLVERCGLIGMSLETLLRDAFGGCRFVGDIRGRGLFWGIEFVKNTVTKETFDPALHFGYNVQQNAFKLGLAVYPGAATVDGVRGDHVIIAPPYNISVLDLKKIVTLLKEAYLQEESKIDV